MSIAALIGPGEHDTAARDRILDGAYDQPLSQLRGTSITECDDFRKVVAGVDMEEGKREAARPERLFSEAQQHQGILAAREEQGRVTALARNFAQDMDRLGFEPAEVMRIGGRRFQRVAYRGFEEGDITHDTASSVSTRTTTSSGRRCNPHSLCSGCSHHQRPARRSSPGSIARVHGAQPILG